MSVRSKRNADAVELNERAQWYAELGGLPHLRPDAVVHMQGLGLFNLKGIAEPVCLVQAWLPDLNLRASSLPPPKNNIAARAAVEDLVRKGLEMDSSSLISASALPEERALVLAKITGPSRATPLTRHLSGFFGDRGSRLGSVTSSQGSATQSTAGAAASNERAQLLGNAAAPSSKAAMLSRRMSSFFMERTARSSAGSSSQGSTTAGKAPQYPPPPQKAYSNRHRSTPRRSHTVGAELYDSVVASLRQIPNDPIEVLQAGNSNRCASASTKPVSNGSEESLTFDTNCAEGKGGGSEKEMPPIPGSLFPPPASRENSDVSRLAISAGGIRVPSSTRGGGGSATMNNSRPSSISMGTPLQSRRSSAVRWADHPLGAVAALNSSTVEEEASEDELQPLAVTIEDDGGITPAD
jgi:hypothetical protein